MFRVIVFFSLITSAFASEKLEVLVNAAASFSATIQQQLEMLQSNPSPTELAEKTIDYAVAKTAYFKALRAEVPEDQCANGLLQDAMRLATQVNSSTGQLAAELARFSK